MWQFLWPERRGRRGADHLDHQRRAYRHLARARDWSTLYQRYLGATGTPTWTSRRSGSMSREIPDDELWDVHSQLKADLHRLCARAAGAATRAAGRGPAAARETHALLNCWIRALTIGFARRFATYKRATLLFRDPRAADAAAQQSRAPGADRLRGQGASRRQARPGVHPPGLSSSRASRSLSGKIVFLEDYDMDMARHLVSGCDLWLNNPIRPHEASGTSGQKASLNGLPNLQHSRRLVGGGLQRAQRLGDWRAARVSGRRTHATRPTRWRSTPRWKTRSCRSSMIAAADDLPHGWIAVMREAIRTVAPAFSMRRMVKEYTQKRSMSPRWPMAAGSTPTTTRWRANWRTGSAPCAPPGRR